MTSLAAAVLIVATATSARGQLNAPVPAPVPPPPMLYSPAVNAPVVKLGTPSAVSSPVAPPAYAGQLPVGSASSAPVMNDIVIHQMPAPAVRTPTSFGAPYTTTGYLEPRRDCGTGGCGTGGCATGSCGSQGCDTCCKPCEPKGRIWGEFDYIVWWSRGDSLPPLVTTSPTGTPAAQAGVLGTPGARTLLDGRPGDDWRNGARVNLGVWLNCEQTVGLQAGGFWLEDAGVNSVFSSSGDPILSRPFTNALTGLPASQLVALPGTLSGSVGVDSRSRIGGLDAALRGNMCCGCCYRLDALIGYRYLRLEDDLSILENLTAGPNAPGNLGVPVGTGILVNDRFETSNTFHGVQLGVAGEYRFWNRWVIDGTLKASFGCIDQVQQIFGSTVVSVPGQVPVQNLGGLLALSSNIGRYSNSEAVIIPEMNLNLAYQLSQYLRLRVGYNLLYVSSVTRPGNIIDTVVNPALIPPPVGNPVPARPAYQTGDSDYFLHGINLGAEVRF